MLNMTGCSRQKELPIMSAGFRQDALIRPRRREGSVVIRVAGVGGAGCNAVTRMFAENISGVECIIMNTDAQALSISQIPHRVQLGEHLTRGQGTGGDPSIGMRAAQESMEEIRNALRGSDMVFVTAGLGGGTGTGAIPVVARVAHEIGALAVGIVSLPFHFEGPRRWRVAQQGLEDLRPHVDTLIAVANERLLAIVDPRQPFITALQTGDDVLRQGVRGIADLITIPGTINLDFADVRSVISKAGTALMAIGEAEGERRALRATQAAIESPLLESSIRGARRILLNITGGNDLTLLEVNEGASIIQSLAHPEAAITFGTVQDEALTGRIRITIIATAIASERQYDTNSRTSIHEMAPEPQLLAAPPKTLTAEGLLGDAWPLPEVDISDNEITLALPALNTQSTESSSEGSQSPHHYVPSPPQGADIDIPSFLRRTS
jgi:cell division protein FtsZ